MKVTLTSDQKTKKADLLKAFTRTRKVALYQVRQAGLAIPKASPEVPECLTDIVEPHPDGGMPTIPADLTALSLLQLGTLCSFWVACADYYRWRGVLFEAKHEAYKELVPTLREMLYNFYLRAAPGEPTADELKHLVEGDPDFISAKTTALEAKLTYKMSLDRLKQLDRVTRLLSREQSRRDIEVRQGELDAGVGGGKRRKVRKGPEKRAAARTALAQSLHVGKPGDEDLL